MQGNYVIGTFEGFTDSNFPQLQVRVSPTWVERLDFAPFNRTTGEATISEELVQGDLIECKVLVKARNARESGKAFVSYYALQVDKVND